MKITLLTFYFISRKEVIFLPIRIIFLHKDSWREAFQLLLLTTKAATTYNFIIQDSRQQYGIQRLILKPLEDFS